MVSLFLGPCCASSPPRLPSRRRSPGSALREPPSPRSAPQSSNRPTLRGLWRRLLPRPRLHSTHWVKLLFSLKLRCCWSQLRVSTSADRCLTEQRFRLSPAFLRHFSGVLLRNPKIRSNAQLAAGLIPSLFPASNHAPEPGADEQSFAVCAGRTGALSPTRPPFGPDSLLAHAGPMKRKPKQE